MSISICCPFVWFSVIRSEYCDFTITELLRFETIKLWAVLKSLWAYSAGSSFTICLLDQELIVLLLSLLLWVFLFCIELYFVIVFNWDVFAFSLVADLTSFVAFKAGWGSRKYLFFTLSIGNFLKAKAVPVHTSLLLVLKEPLSRWQV